MKVVTKLERVREALLKNDDIESVRFNAEANPFISSQIIVKYKNGLTKVYTFGYNDTPKRWVKAYNKYCERKEVEKDRYK